MSTYRTTDIYLRNKEIIERNFRRSQARAITEAQSEKMKSEMCARRKTEILKEEIALRKEFEL